MTVCYGLFLLCGSNIIITHKKLYLLIDMKIMPKAFGLEVERAMAQLYFWLELGELSQLGSAQLAILDLLASSAQLSSPI